MASDLHLPHPAPGGSEGYGQIGVSYHILARSTFQSSGYFLDNDYLRIKGAIMLPTLRVSLKLDGLGQYLLKEGRAWGSLLGRHGPDPTICHAIISCAISKG